MNASSASSRCGRRNPITARSIGSRFGRSNESSAYSLMKSAARQLRMGLMLTLPVSRVDLGPPRRHGELCFRLLELLVDRFRAECLAAKPSAADSPPPEREVHARVVELRQHGGFDLVERHLLPRDRVRRPFERAGNLPDAVRRILLCRSTNRIVIDDRLQHERVVRVQPERLLLIAAPLRIARRDRRRVQRRDVAAQPRAIALQRPVVNQPITHVQIEQRIERHVKRFEVGRRCVVLCGYADGSQSTTAAAASIFFITSPS